MLNVQEASQKAMEYLKILNPTSDKIQLEEIEYIDITDTWLVTLSYSVMGEDVTNPFNFSNRKFKIFNIDSLNGSVRSMKIREFK